MKTRHVTAGISASNLLPGGIVMTKKHFIALANHIKEANRVLDDSERYSEGVISSLADFCKSQNSNFDRELWLDYIAGKCGPCGGEIKSIGGK